MMKDMLRELRIALDVLPDLLDHPLLWRAQVVDYSAPHCQKMWASYPFPDGEEGHVVLNRISPSTLGNALFHPHPWPLACKVLRGRFRMGVGQGPDRPQLFTMLGEFGPGSMWEMTEPDGWHVIAPMEKVWCVSLVHVRWESEAEDRGQFRRPPPGHIYPKLDQATQYTMRQEFKDLLCA